MFGDNNCIFSAGCMVNCLCSECNEYVSYKGGIFTLLPGLPGLLFCCLLGVRLPAFLFLDGSSRQDQLLDVPVSVASLMGPRISGAACWGKNHLLQCFTVVKSHFFSSLFKDSTLGTFQA